MSSKLHTNDAINLSRLPQWAQKHIEALQRERDVAVRALNEYCDKETPSPFVFQEIISTGEEQGPSFKVRYVQAHNMEIRYMGLVVLVGLRDEGITIQYSTSKNLCGMANLRPTSYQSFILTPDAGDRLFRMAQDAGKLIGSLRERLANCADCSADKDGKVLLCSQCKRDQKVIDEASK